MPFVRGNADRLATEHDLAEVPGAQVLGTALDLASLATVPPACDALAASRHGTRRSLSTSPLRFGEDACRGSREQVKRVHVECGRDLGKSGDRDVRLASLNALPVAPVDLGALRCLMERQAGPIAYASHVASERSTQRGLDGRPSGHRAHGAEATR
jgi:hypothetical protein